MDNYADTIISQYATSPVLCAMIGIFNNAVDPAGTIDAFITNVMDVTTAKGYGLDVLGRIVGVSRVLAVASGVNLGFTGPSAASGDSFNIAPFYNGGSVTSSYALTDAAFRTLILAKAASNICDGSIPSINLLLRTIFAGRGSCYCTTGGNMTMTYSFHFALTPVEAAIVAQTDILPTPAGVSFSIVQGLP